MLVDHQTVICDPLPAPAASRGLEHLLDEGALPSLGVVFGAEVAHDSLGDVAERLDLLA